MEQKLKQKLYEIIFEADTREGRLFDLVLLGIIALSVFLVILESVPSVDRQYHHVLRILEWTITVIFSIEYTLRIYVVSRPLRYIFSFYGIVDLLSVLPSYIAIFFVGGHSLVVIRILRLLRVFRILKLNRYSQAGQTLSTALWNSRRKIGVFLFFIRK
ncbi:MAG: ion transporter [Prolixibacteraceae bacterium]|jgi:voltage-gated potassium channel|nr:ion transporter [Prolixibacteraceae bacterium]